MKIRIIHLLCAIQFFSIPLPTSCMAWSDSIGWSDHSKYMIQTCLVALGTIITYEKLKSWWVPPAKIDCSKLIQLTTQNTECASRLKNLLNQLCIKELEAFKEQIKSVQKQIEALQTIKNEITPLIEMYKSYAKEMDNFLENDLKRCKAAFESQKEQLTQYQTLIQKIERTFNSLDVEVALLKRITGNGVRLNGISATLTEAYLRSNKNLNSLNRRLRELEELASNSLPTSS